MIKLIRFLLLLPVAFASAQQPPAFQLEKSAVPKRYAVELNVNPADQHFSGTIDIELDIRQPSAVIWLNANDIRVDEASLKSAAGAVKARVVPEKADFVGFAFDRPVPAGGATLHIAYRGEINSKASKGIFRNKVGDDWYAFTQFEAIDARRAFPCFDEPGYKVPWQVTLRIPQALKAFSNTPEISASDEANGLKTVRFAETRPLPSYLVAFAVGPFEVVDAGRAGKSQVPLRIITPKGRADQARYAADVTGQILDTLENYFGVPYAYPKLDSIAVPLFFGAMENPGLITYGDTIILAQPSEDSIERQRGYASTAAHEMAHLWFGDLVTTEWWNDIWLNEAFATWMANKALTLWKPEWHTEISGALQRQGAMGSDSIVSARKIRQPVNSNNDIANAFDNITYGKGAAVIYMFEHWAGTEPFRQGVQLYLKQHADGNATASDFVSAVSTAAKRDIAPAFFSFLDQAGVPLVTAELRCASGQPPAVALSQQRYLPLGSGKPPEPVKPWTIPVCMRYEGGQECAVLNQPSGEVRLNTGACPAWVEMNAGQSGYYRMLYRGTMLRSLAADGGKRLTPEERIGLLGDARALMSGGELPAQDALRLVPEFANDPTRQVAETTIRVAGSLYQNFVPANLRPNYERFIEKTYGARARELGWEPKPGESDDIRLLRPGLTGLVADEGQDKQLIAGADALARKWFTDRAAIAPGMVEPVLTTAARFGGRELYEKFAAQLKVTQDPRQREQILGAMASFRQPDIVRENLNYLLNGELDFREAIGLLFGPLGDPETRALPFEFVRANYDKLLSRLPTAVGTDYAAFLPTTGQAFCDTQHRNEVESFFKPKMARATGGPRMLAQTIERIDQCIAVKKVQEPGVEAFLRNY